MVLDAGLAPGSPVSDVEVIVLDAWAVSDARTPSPQPTHADVAAPPIDVTPTRTPTTAPPQDAGGDIVFSPPTLDEVISRVRGLVRLTLKSGIARFGDSTTLVSATIVVENLVGEMCQLGSASGRALDELTHLLAVFQSAGDRRYEALVKLVLIPWDGRSLHDCFYGRVKTTGADEDSLVYCSPPGGPYGPDPAMSPLLDSWWARWEVCFRSEALADGFVHRSLATALLPWDVDAAEALLLRGASRLALALGCTLDDEFVYLTDRAVRAAVLWDVIGADVRPRTSALRAALQRLRRRNDGLVDWVIPPSGGHFALAFNSAMLEARIANTV